MDGYGYRVAGAEVVAILGVDDADNRQFGLGDQERELALRVAVAAHHDVVGLVGAGIEGDRAANGRAAVIVGVDEGEVRKGERGGRQRGRVNRQNGVQRRGGGGRDGFDEGAPAVGARPCVPNRTGRVFLGVLRFARLPGGSVIVQVGPLVESSFHAGGQVGGIGQHVVGRSGWGAVHVDGQRIGGEAAAGGVRDLGGELIIAGGRVKPRYREDVGVGRQSGQRAVYHAVDENRYAVQRVGGCGHGNANPYRVGDGLLVKHQCLLIKCLEVTVGRARRYGFSNVQRDRFAPLNIARIGGLGVQGVETGGEAGNTVGPANLRLGGQGGGGGEQVRFVQHHFEAGNGSVIAVGGGGNGDGAAGRETGSVGRAVNGDDRHGGGFPYARRAAYDNAVG